MVVVVDELCQDPPQVALADGNQVVEALLAGCPHPAFRDRVRAGRPNRGTQTRDSHAGRALAEVGAPDPVTVMDQISRLAVPGWLRSAASRPKGRSDGRSRRGEQAGDSHDQ
jgi:hypothetical protein